MKIVYLGTSAAAPTVERSLTCICLVRENEVLMFDAGEGAQVAYLKAGLPWNKKMKIFVTHLHGDHCLGILGLLQTMSLQKRTEAVEIYGPSGIEEFITANIKVLNFGLPFPVFITIVDEGNVVKEKNYQINCCEAQHGIPAFSYCFDSIKFPIYVSIRGPNSRLIYASAALSPVEGCTSKLLYPNLINSDSAGLARSLNRKPNICPRIGDCVITLSSLVGDSNSGIACDQIGIPFCILFRNA